MEKTGCKIICGAPTTLAVKGLMMMMIMQSDSRGDSVASRWVLDIKFPTPKFPLLYKP